MTSIWLVVFPLLFAAVAFLFLLAKNLHFFSRAARQLDQINIPDEFNEIRTHELEALVSDEADSGKATLRERQKAVTVRHREIGKRLRLLISNCALFCEVARFHIGQMDLEEVDSPGAGSGLPLRVMDRAAIVQFMAAACLVKLMLLDCCRAVCPLYVPHSANHFHVRGGDLVASYRRLSKEMLDLAKQYYDDITYTRLIVRLTGTFTIQDAAELSRL
jgi:hypothetical protein